MTLVVKTAVSLSLFTTLKTGGEAQYFATVKNLDELIEAVSFAEQKKLPLFVLGGGSNLLVADSGYQGLIIKMEFTGRDYIEIGNDLIKLEVGAGEILDEVISETVTKNYWGLENLSHIPGTVGATPIQNVGAYGVEVAELIESVTVFNIVTKEIVILENKDCNFNYRDSFFKTDLGRKNIIIKVNFILSKIATPKLNYADLNKKFIDLIPTPKLIREEIISIRKNKFPDWSRVGTAGSFFKNPVITQEQADKLLSMFPDVPTYNTLENKVKVSLGSILDKVCNLRGFRIGNVRLYEMQALVLVADIGATSTEIISFAKKITDEVYEKTNLNIFIEVTLI